MDARDLAVAPVTYTAVGGTRAPDLLAFPPAGFRPRERSARIGHGDQRWAFATTEVLTWGVKRRSGFRVEPIAMPDADAEHVYAPDGREFVQAGTTAVLHLGPLREPVRVVYTIEEDDRVGFGYGTLPGHPLIGEESFLVERRDDGTVWIVVRSFARPAGSWVAVWPLIRVAQRLAVRRYLRALAGPLR